MNVKPDISVGAVDVDEEIVVAVPVALEIVVNVVDVSNKLAVSVIPWTLVVTAECTDTAEAAVPAES